MNGEKEIELEVRLLKNYSSLITEREEQMKSSLRADRTALKRRADELALKKKYAEALAVIEGLIADNKTIKAFMGTVDTHVITAPKDTKTTEGTVVWVASDWHTDEKVDG